MMVSVQEMKDFFKHAPEIRALQSDHFAYMRSQILFPRHCFLLVMISSASSQPLQRLLWPATARIHPPNSSHDLSNEC